MDLSDPGSLAVLLDTPRLEHLEFEDVEGMHVVVYALADSIEGKDGSIRWLCPRLQTLRLHDIMTARKDLIVRLVKTKVVHVSWKCIRDGLERSAKPETIRAQMDLETYDESRAFLPWTK